ncbi:MAG: hypothetical protein PHH55_01755 [Candidatus Delongbacteria bacterium]|nr:hypothetical protein [Candidatus Delongbacteria bacterium]
MEKCCRLEEMIKKEELVYDVIAEEGNNEILEHINSCSDCGKFVSDLKRTSDSVRSLLKVTVSDSFDAALRSRINMIRNEQKKERVEAVPLYSRVFYYASGIAAIFIAFFYISSLGLFDNTTDGPLPSLNSEMSLASENAVSKGNSAVDSLENMNKSVQDDEDLRLKVSTGE